MKIGIITFHFVSNYGGVLQCYALQEYLKKCGHEVSVINYRPGYHTVRYTPVKNPVVMAKSNWNKNSGKKISTRFCAMIRGAVKGIVLSVTQKDKEKSLAFDKFITMYLNQTAEYKTLKQLQKNPPKMDVYVSGSDQLWNPDLLDCSFDEAYFLNFGDKNIKRLTYAVSSKENYSESEIKQLQGLCGRLDAISLREDNEGVSKVAQKEISINVDPTLLMDKTFYEEIESDRLVDKKYVFVYGFENLKGIDDAVKKIVELTGVTVVNGSPHRIRLSVECEKIYSYSPNDFLSYIKNADYVVTNSFHGLAFSIIYRKQFCAIPHTTRGKRMIDLLRNLKLESRQWTDANFDWSSNIDYGETEELIEKMRDDTGKYFDKNI